MTRTISIAAALLLPFAVVAAEPNLKAVEEQMQKVADAAAPSVVSVVVSHSKEYKPLRNPKPGQLGAVTAEDLPVREPLGPRIPRWMPQVTVPHPLDLSAAENVADHLFGSGVVLDDRDSLVLVPYHLIDGAKKVFVRGAKGGSYADIHAADAKSDLAVLKLLAPIPDLKAVKLADLRLTPGADGEKPTIKKGAMLLALGHPTAAAVGDGSASVSWGTLSNIRMKSGQPQPAQSGPPDPLKQRPLNQQGGLIQVDARAAFGSTGAAVFNTDGELLGVGSSVAAVYGSEVNGGYAIPMDTNYRRVVATLKEGKEVEYGFLGVSPADAFGVGVRVNEVSPGCPAALAGVQQEDIITAIDGHKLNGQDDLLIYGGGALAGNQVTLDINRGGRELKVKLTLAKNVNQLPFIATVTPPTPFGIKIDYFSMRAAGGGQRERFPVNPPQGVLVRDVEAGSAGERALKDIGHAVKGAWVVTHVDGKAVTSPKEYFALTVGKKSVKLSLADPDDPSKKAEISLP
jgi:serine protease Do